MIKVYLENRPPLAEYLETDVMDHLPVGEIKRIATETGNHWRKIFNVYAKLIYCLAEMTQQPLLQQYGSWQDYRDECLLQQGSDTELHLGSASLDGLYLTDLSVSPLRSPRIHIVMGKAFSERLLMNVSMDYPLEWLDKDFAINRQQNIIVCPYFDYRQLSNVKIEFLSGLIRSLQNAHCGQNTHHLKELM